MKDTRSQIVSQLGRLRTRYETYKDCGFNETETCEYLIDGLLRTLDWDPADPSIGRREPAIRTASGSDIYADYSFFDRRYAPQERSTARTRVFVEAKRISRSLGVDAEGRCQSKQTKKWLEQVAVYGLLRGARWLVLTNGHQLAVFRPSQDGDSLYGSGQLVFQSYDEMLSRIEDLLLLSRENVWSENIDRTLENRRGVQHQIQTPRSRVRSLFVAHDLRVFFDDKIADFAGADNLIPTIPDPLFYQGVNASWNNILANQDVVRPQLIDQIFRAYYYKSNICVIRSESGQGKTTLMFRFAYEYRDLFYILELRQLSLAEVRFCELGVRNLAELHKPILILVDDLTRKQGWSRFLHAIANTRHVYILATTREDEWAQVDVRGIESRVAYVSPKLEYETAKLILDGISLKGLKKSTSSLWEIYPQSRGRLLEFVTLLTQGKHLESILEAQISSLAAQDISLLAVLRFISFFHALGLSIEVGMLELGSADISPPHLLRMLDQLSGEFILKVADGTYEGLHELRSRIITDILHRRFFAFSDSLIFLLEHTRIEQFETLVKNLPLLSKTIWKEAEVSLLIARLRMIDDPLVLIPCIRAFGKSALVVLSDQIHGLAQHVAEQLIDLDPSLFILTLHQAFGPYGRGHLPASTGTDRMILERIPTTILVSHFSLALPLKILDGQKEWEDYEQLAEWTAAAGIARRTIGPSVLLDMIQFIGERDFVAFATEQTDFLGLLTLLEVFHEHLAPHAVEEIIKAWLALDWDSVIVRLNWDEQKGILEKLTELESTLWPIFFAGIDWRRGLLDAFASSIVGWDPPDATLDFLDEITAIDQELAERLKQHPEVLQELEYIADRPSEENGVEHEIQHTETQDLEELVGLAPEEIANRLTLIPSTAAVRLIEVLDIQAPEKLRRTMAAIGVDGLVGIGESLERLEDIESFVFMASESDRTILSDICQALKIHDADLVLERARLRHESEVRVE